MFLLVIIACFFIFYLVNSVLFSPLKLYERYRREEQEPHFRSRKISVAFLELLYQLNCAAFFFSVSTSSFLFNRAMVFLCFFTTRKIKVWDLVAALDPRAPAGTLCLRTLVVRALGRGAGKGAGKCSCSGLS